MIDMALLKKTSPALTSSALEDIYREVRDDPPY
jgi:hypothetical protein